MFSWEIVLYYDRIKADQERMDIRLETYDVLVAGAGYAGAVSARALAEKGIPARL